MLRYQVLDRCFSDFKRKYEIDDLVDKVNEVLYDLNVTEVKLRQIWDDIKYMRDRMTYNAPIRHIGIKENVVTIAIQTSLSQSSIMSFLLKRSQNCALQ